MAAAMSLHAVSVFPTQPHVVRTEVTVIDPPVNWRWPQLDPWSSSEISGAVGSAFSIRAMNSSVGVGVAPLLKLGFACIAFRRSMANGTEGKSCENVPVYILLVT